MILIYETQLEGKSSFWHLGAHVEANSFRDACEKQHQVRPKVVRHGYSKQKFYPGNPEVKHSRGCFQETLINESDRDSLPVTIGF